jgi:hypothetical protein
VVINPATWHQQFGRCDRIFKSGRREAMRVTLRRFAVLVVGYFDYSAASRFLKNRV